MPKLIMMSGPSGSGKSTTAKKMLAEDGNTIRINRDELRLMSIHKWSPRREEWIKEMEDSIVRGHAKFKTHIIVDDTNLRQGDHDFWRNMAKEIGYEFKVLKVNPGLAECLRRDSLRRDHEHVGRAAIERQFLRGKLIEWPTDKQVVIWDVDGTFADLTHRTPWIKIGGFCPACRISHNGVAPNPNCGYCQGTGVLQKKHHDMFYSLVQFDRPIENIIKWNQGCAKDYFNVVVTGRSPERCENETIQWLNDNGVVFEHIFFRMAHQHDDDVRQKQMILSLMLESGLKREQIAFVVDDRPSVVQMWRNNGIKVYPVRGRDDDEFYQLMDDFEKTHPRPDLEAANEGNV